MGNLWNDLPPGPNLPGVVNVVVEIPKGSRNKYEYDKHYGVIRLDRVLYAAVEYPGDYGLIPQTLVEDNDPLDVLVMVNEPTFPGAVIQARPIGLLRLQDGETPDNKLLAVPASDPLFQDYHDIADIPPHFLLEVEHFFAVYKDLEGIRVKPRGWDNAEKAREYVSWANDGYREQQDWTRGWKPS